MADETEAAPQRSQRSQRTKQRRERRAALPATFVDTYSLDWSRDSVRISFGEDLHHEWHYRVAVVLPMADAELLGEALTRIAKDAKTGTKEPS
jgi:hypothetical protein